VRSVVQWLFALIGKGVDGGGEFVALLCVESLVVFVVLPGCLHQGTFNSLAFGKSHYAKLDVISPMGVAN
jgi:hypothetical protein